jgi:hypothetical protein
VGIVCKSTHPSGWSILVGLLPAAVRAERHHGSTKSFDYEGACNQNSSFNILGFVGVLSFNHSCCSNAIEEWRWTKLKRKCTESLMEIAVPYSNRL